MARHNAAPAEDPDQGAFFEVALQGNGVTDPTGYAVLGRIAAVHPDGTYAEVSPEVEPALSSVEVVEGIAVVIAQDAHHRAQSGKHSPLQRTGNYSSDLKPGDYLPEFGPVTNTNFRDAELHAAKLDRQREHLRAS